MRHGLVELAGERPRRGRPLKLYRASAERFFVPFATMPHATLEAFYRRLEATWYPRMIAGLIGAWRAQRPGPRDWGIAVSRHESGLLKIGFSADPELAFDDDLYLEAPAIAHWDTRLHLGPEDVRSLREELLAVVDRYLERRSGPRQVLHLGLAPWSADPG